jgi:hypothetical protein
MSGKYLGVERPEEPPHRCALPPIHSLATWGVWRCECGKAYRAEPYDPGHDTQPGDERYVRWARYPVRDA